MMNTKITSLYSDNNRINITMKKNIIIVVLIILSMDSLNAQDTIQFDLASRIDTTNAEVSNIVGVYKSYFSPDSFGKYKFNNAYWNQKEIDDRVWDLSRQHMLRNIIEGFEERLKISILSVEKKKGIYELRAQIQSIHEKKFDIYLIHKVGFIKENDHWVMQNHFNSFIDNWKTVQVMAIEYKCSATYPFNDSLSLEANKFVMQLYDTLNIPQPSEKIQYVLAQDFDEFSAILGFDYFAYHFTSGVTTHWNSTIRTMKGEFHAHELVHLVAKYKTNFILTEGLADFLGTQIQDPEKYERQRQVLRKNIKEQEDKDLNRYFINKDIGWLGFNYNYTLGAYLCEFISNRFGWETLLAILNENTRSHDDLKSTIEQKTGMTYEMFLVEFRDYIVD